MSYLFLATCNVEFNTQHSWIYLVFFNFYFVCFLFRLWAIPPLIRIGVHTPFSTEWSITDWVQKKENLVFVHNLRLPKRKDPQIQEEGKEALGCGTCVCWLGYDYSGLHETLYLIWMMMQMTQHPLVLMESVLVPMMLMIYNLQLLNIFLIIHLMIDKHSWFMNIESCFNH